MSNAFLHLLNRLRKHLEIQIQAHGVNGAGLFAAKDVARAADFKIFHRDLVAGAQRFGFFESVQSFLRFFG